MCDRKIISKDSCPKQELNFHYDTGVIGKSKSITENKEVNNYADIFIKGKQLQKNVYIQGEPGMGKSVFATKLTLDWCDSICPKQTKEENITENTTFATDSANRHFADTEMLCQFSFLFLVSLRDCYEKCDIEVIIQDAIFSELNETEQYTETFLKKVLSKERCLIILDGLDEWTHPKNSSCRRKPLAVPHRRTGNHCTFITLTRPWKLAVLPLEDINIEQLFDIAGVVDKRTLLGKYVDGLNKQATIKRELYNFELSLTRKSEQLLDTPILAVSLLCLWFEESNLPESVTQIYCCMLEMLGKRSSQNEEEYEPQESSVLPFCFKDKFWCIHNADLLEKLGELAFFTLHSDGKQSKVVFSDIIVARYLSKELRERSLKTGILTRHQVPSLNARKSSYCFLHKTFQEMLAACFFVGQTNDIDKLNKEIKTFYSENEQSILGIDSFFVFICGLKPVVASKISKHICDEISLLLQQMLNKYFSHTDENYRASLYSTNRCLNNAQDLLLQGFFECSRNTFEYEQVDIALRHAINFEDVHESFEHNIKFEALMRGSDIIESVIWLVSENVSVRELKINLEKSRSSLKYIMLESAHGEGLCIHCLGLHQLKNLHTMCLKDFGDICQKCNNCATSEWTGENKVTFDNELLSQVCLDSICCQVPLDFTACNVMHSLQISNSSSAVFINTTQLKHCVLEDYDFSKGNIAKAIAECQSLETLDIYECPYFYYVVRSLSHLKQLQKISLEKVDLNNFDISFLDNEQQEYLDNISSSSCATIITLPPQLQYLRISASDLGPHDIFLADCLVFMKLDCVTMTSASWRRLANNILPCKHLKACILRNCLMSTAEYYLSTMHTILHCKNIELDVQKRSSTENYLIGKKYYGVSFFK